MNGRAIAIGSGLAVIATAAGVATAATAAAERADSRARVQPARVRSVDLPSVDPAIQAKHDAVAIARYVEAVNTARWYEAATANILREELARRQAAARRRSSGSGGGDVLACIKHRESRGQYGAVNSSSGAAGAYQFMPNTWDNTARHAGRTDLVGVNPSGASPADQEAMARHLLGWQGLGPWGGGCG